MILKNILKATGLVSVVAAAGVTGYIYGKDTATLEYKPVVKQHLKEVSAHKEWLKDRDNTIYSLRRFVDIQREMLDKPVYLGATDIQFSNADKFVISAYSPYDDVSGLNHDGDPNTTATGTKPKPGTFAVDPKVIPYGSKVTIVYPDGTVERGVAEDTGGAIKNNRIDVFRYTYKTAMKFGMRDALVFWEVKK